MLSSKLGNSSELLSSYPDLSIIKQNKKQKLSCENLEHGEKKKVAGKRSYEILDVSVQPTRKWICTATEMTPNHHRNDPHHRNDTGGHHRNDPRNIGNGVKRTTKTGQQFSACFLFIHIASFLRCVVYLLPHFVLQ